MNQPTPTIGEVMARSRRDALRAIAQVATASAILMGLGYTGIHNYNLFRRALPPDQAVFALIPVLLLEGSIILFLGASFIWLSSPAQRALSTAFSWTLFAIVAANTLIDTLINYGQPMPDWLTTYATLLMPITPVLVVAMLKIIIDADPAKRRLQIEQTIEAARAEALYQAAQRALAGEITRAAIADYASQYEQAMARDIIAAAPSTPANGHGPILAAAPSAPANGQRPKASKATNGASAEPDGHSGA